MISKIYCHKTIYWNLTKPYFRYEVGKWYNAKRYLSKSEVGGFLVEQKIYYTFENCDMILDEEDFGKHFWTQDEFRELKIKEIINQ